MRWSAVLALAVFLTCVGTIVGSVEGTWAWLGVRIRDLTESEMDELAAHHGIREGYGVVIVGVVEGAPAARVGLKAGDVVVAFNARPITDTQLLQHVVAAAPVDHDVTLTVLRPQGRTRVTVRLAPMPAEVVGDRVAAEFGFLLREPEPQGERGGSQPAPESPTVAAVAPGSPAERAALAVGDVLLQIGETAVPSRDAVRRALATADLRQPLRLTIRRGEQTRTLTLPTP